MSYNNHYYDRYDTYVPNPLVQMNPFFSMAMEEAELPVFEEVRRHLPQPYWHGKEEFIRCYWKAWELAFDNLRKPNAENGYIANFIDTMFNDCIFMWDSCFIMMFTKYGSRAFPFQRTLDNFYRKQHKDGFICRQIGIPDGKDRFHRYDPVSTGPNIFAWTEWEYYNITGDKERLERIFPVLKAYHQWLRMYRTWPDGTYWSSGWGCGMDNQPRLPEDLPEIAEEFYHGHQVWVDICLQQVLSANLLCAMADEIGKGSETEELRKEAGRLAKLVNERFWDEEAAYYHDLTQDGKLLDLKSIGAYWALLAGLVPEERLERFVGHLDNESEFKRPHRVPSLSADHPRYEPRGKYWRGGVWPSTNYMVLRGLTKYGYDSLAYDIALNHVSNVVKVYEQTGTLWENYSPESAQQAIPAKPNFVGWTGLPPIAVLFEYVFGLRADVPNARLVWDVRVLEEFGVSNYPFGISGVLDLKCKARNTAVERPEVEIKSNIPVEVVVRWEGGEETIRCMP